jgi:hypothetical protein
MKAGTQNHLKTKRLKRLLKRPLYQIVGVLETLWLLAADCADEGNIGKFTDEEIADYLEWDGNPVELVRALSDAGWTDLDASGRPVIHGWIEHCPEYIKDRIRKRMARATKEGHALCPSRTYVSSPPDTAGHTPDLAGLRPSIPNPTNPNQSQPNPTKQEPSADAEGSKPKPVYSAAFLAWYAAYPRKVGKQDASTAYGRAIARIATGRGLSKTDAHLLLLETTSRYAVTPAGNAGTFTPHPATWLNRGSYEDDPSEWTLKEPQNGKPTNRVGPGQRYRE